MDAAVAARVPAIDFADEPSLCVGAATIDLVSRDAKFGDQVERLQPQNLKVLVALARSRNHVVTRDQLVDLCWDGRFVGDDVLNRAISTLRQFAERSGGFVIETVPRVGYRLVDQLGARHRGRWIKGSIVLLLLLAAAIAATLKIGPSQPRAPTTLAVAILPFEMSAGDPTARAFAFAAHDSVAHALSLSRYAVTEVKPGAARDGGPAKFLMSADISGTPDKITATVRMEETTHHIIVYSQRFEAPRGQAWALVDRIGPQVAGSLGWTEPVLLIDRNHPSDPEILRQLLGERTTLETTRGLASGAPDSAIAQMSLAFQVAFNLSDLPRAKRGEAVLYGRRATGRAIALAPEFGGVYIPWCLLHSSVRLAECEDRLRGTIARDPDSPWVAHFLGEELVGAGRTSEAAELADHSLASDPFAVAKINFALLTLEATGQGTEAEKLYVQGRRWWPEDDDLFWARAHGMTYRGDIDALARFENEFPRTRAMKGYEPLGALTTAVKRRDLAAAKTSCSRPELSFRSDICMLILAQLGDPDDSFALAERLYPDRLGRSRADEERIFLDHPWVPETDILVGPMAAAMRRDPRFLELARRLGLLAYWRSGRLPDFCNPPRAEPICPQLRHA